jgi:tripartite-type tricarboxylate transporter receptor subunit TctC
MHTLKRVVIAACVAATGMLSWPQAFAQAWPHRQPIKLVAVFPPGGSVDQVARILAVPLAAQLGANIVVENKGGASGSIGAAAVAAAPPDGYTFAVVFDTFGVNPALIPGMPYDSRKDLDPVVLVGTSPMVLATYAGSEYKTFADVVGAAKAKKNVSYGSIGSGSLGHLAMALLGKNGQMDWQHIPYKGGGPLMADAVAGHVPLSIGSVFLIKPTSTTSAYAPWPSPPANAHPICPTCRPWPKAALPDSMRPRGGRSWRRPRPRPRSSGA